MAALALLLLPACGGGGGGGAASQAPAAPVITSFVATPSSISSGQSSQLLAIYSNGTGTLENSLGGTGVISSGTPLSVSPASTATYTLTVTNSAGSFVKQSLTITVTAPQVRISSFSVSPTIITPGQTATLTALFTNATSASIDQGVGPVVSGAPYTVQPAATTIYTLTANGNGGPVTQSLILTVTGGPPVSITSFTAVPSTLTPGLSATLLPVFTNATSASIDHGVGTVTSGTGYVVSPATTTTYLLTANGTGGPVTSPVTVTVQSPTTATIWGNVVDGPIAGGTVQFFALNGDGTKGSLLASTTTDASGNYTVTLAPAATQPVLATVSGGSYLDEVKGTTVPLGAGDTLEAVLPAGTAQAAITPLTSMAAARARTLAKAGVPLTVAVASANAGVAQQYNLRDILAASPKSPRDATAMQGTVKEDRFYSLILGGLSKEASDLNTRSIDLARALATDLQDGILDGKNGAEVVTLPTLGPVAHPEGPSRDQPATTITLPPGAGIAGLQNAINQFWGSPINLTGLEAIHPIPPDPVLVGASPGGMWILTGKLAAWTSGKSGSDVLQANGGTAPYTWTLVSGTYPGSIGLAPNGVVSGTAPTLVGGNSMVVYGPVTVRVADALGRSLTMETFLTVLAGPPTFIQLPAPVWTEGVFNSTPVASGSGGTGALHFASPSFAYGAPPLGTVVLLNGNLAGTAAKGTGGLDPGGIPYHFPVQVIDSVGAFATGEGMVTIRPPNKFQGTVSGTWAGSCSPGGAVSGTFSIVIAADGAVTGSYTGSGSGSIAGTVDNSGNYTAGSGGASGGVSWVGTFTKSGTTLTANGGWSSPDCSGGWSGSGTATQ